MCLDTVTKRFPGKTKRELWAWKVFRTLGGIPDFPHKHSTALSYDSWMVADAVNVETSTLVNRVAEEYVTGFHVYCSHGAAKEHYLFFGGKQIRRVKVRGITVKGMQEGRIVFVAKELYVPAPKGGRHE